MPNRATKKRKVKVKRGRTVKPSPYLVFISHSSFDLWVANQMAKELTALGAQVWLDEKDLEGGDILLEKIISGIDACQEAIVLVSPKSVKSQWVAFEIGAVRGQHKRVTPILNNVSPDAIAPMKGVKAVDLNRFDQFLD